MPHKALVTGGTGFIGSHLVEALVSRNWQVLCLVRTKSRTRFLQSLPVEIVRGDPRDSAFLERAVEDQDYVFHLAARIRSAPKKVYQDANHFFTRNLAEACLRNRSGIKRFVYVSSIAAAGPSAGSSYSDESQPASPTSEYGRTKLKGEECLKRLAERLPSTIIRPPNVYGPRQKETGMLIKIIRSRVVPMLSSDREKTSLIYVKDLIQGIILAALSVRTINQIYYLTDEKGYSWRHLILAMKREILGSSFFLPIPEPVIALLASCADLYNRIGKHRVYFGKRVWRALIETPWLFTSRKAARDFGFRARYTLNEGIAETVHYHKKREKRGRFYFS